MPIKSSEQTVPASALVITEAGYNTDSINNPFNLTSQSSKSIKSSIFLICLQISCHSTFFYLCELQKIIKSQTIQSDAANHNAQAHSQSSHTYIICTFLRAKFLTTLPNLPASTQCILKRRTQPRLFRHNPMEPVRQLRGGGFSPSRIITSTNNINNQNHYNTTTSTSSFTREVESISRSDISQSLGPANQIRVISISRRFRTAWRPPCVLPLQSSSAHPLHLTISQCEKEILAKYCCLEPNVVMAHSALTPTVQLKVSDFRDLLSHGLPTIDDIMTSFLEIHCSNYGIAFLTPHFIPLLRTEKWTHVRRFFATTSRLRSITRPSLTGEQAIAIPCFVNGNHWTSIVRREVNDEVL
jgi:hypothetical protein